MSFKKSYLIFVLLLSISPRIFGSPLNENSVNLYQVWNNSNLSDFNRLNIIDSLIKTIYLYSEPDSSLIYAELQHELAIQKDIKPQIANALNTKGIIYANRGELEISLDLFKESLTINKVLKDKKGISSSMNNIGLIYEKMNNLIQAMEYFTKSLKLNEQLEDKKNIAATLNNIGLVFQIQNDFTKAISYFSRGLAINNEIKNMQGVASGLNNIGLIYFTQHNYDKAIQNYDSSLVISRQIDDKKKIGSLLNNIGEIYFQKGDFEKAIEYYNESLHIKNKIGDQQGIANSLINIGIVYRNKKEFKKAIEYSNSSLLLAEETNNLNVIMKAANNLYKIYEEQGLSAEALLKYKLYISVRDSINNTSVQKEVLRKELEFNYEKKSLEEKIIFINNQKEMDLLLQRTITKRNYIYVSIAFIFILAIIFIRFKSIQNKQERIQLLGQIDLLKSDVMVKKAFSNSLVDAPELNRDLIERFINSKLNDTDWNILTTLYHNPAISNKELSEKVSISVEGARSSLGKMYKLFDLKTSRNQRFVLVVEATKISNTIQNS